MVKGGARPGAGRKKGSTQQAIRARSAETASSTLTTKRGRGRPSKAPTVCVRIPAELATQVKQLVSAGDMRIPLYSSKVQAGMPSAADDHVADTIDLNTFLVQRPAQTFLVYATGDSMKDAGIADGDLLIVDSSIIPANGKMVVAAVDGDLTVKYLINKKGEGYLMPANPAFNEIPINSETGAIILGVVTGSVKKH